MPVIQSAEYVNHNLPKEYLPETLKVYVDALQLIWYVLIPMSGMGFISSFFVKHHSMNRPESGQKDGVVKEELKEEPFVLEIPSNDGPVPEEAKDKEMGKASLKTLK